MKAASQTINKYFAGTAFAELPFFAAAHACALIFDLPADGFSFPYQVAINLAAIVFAVCGFYFLKKWLLRHGLNPLHISIVLFGLAFGTHLFYYTVDDASLSHAYSFGIASLFIYHAHSFFRKNHAGRFMASILLAAWMILIRPVNGMILFALPFLAGSHETFVTGMKFVFKNKLTVVVSGLLLICIPAIQLLVYHWQTGHYFAYTYGEEHLSILQPHLSDFLFSYKKGLFVYTPLLLFGVAGFSYLYGKSKWEFFTLSTFLMLVIYVLSCWSVWWYGGSFSQRPMVEFLPFFCFPFTLLIGQLESSLKKLSFFLIFIFCIFLNQVQVYQYRYNFIHWENMDKEHYWRVFLRIDQLKNGVNANRDLLEKK
ncbi:MAG TPA: hypothetical protein PLU53_14240 [Bacteroidia bacterium]|nr:hypothetical protein [Bacteroidia bacterium]